MKFIKEVVSQIKQELYNSYEVKRNKKLNEMRKIVLANKP